MASRKSNGNGNALIVQMISDLRDDMNGRFDHVVDGQRAVFDRLHEHEQEDARQFEEIKIAAATAAGAAKERAEEAAAKANRTGLWAGLLGAGGSGGLVALVEHLWKR
jgi:hypothetical protein